MSVPDNAPKLHKNSLRWTVMLYVATDPPYSWTPRSIEIELESMGHTWRSVRKAVENLVQRGLIKRTEWKEREYLMSTSAGIRSMKQYIPTLKEVV